AGMLSVTASYLLARMANPLVAPRWSAPGTSTTLVPPARMAEELSKHFSRAAVEQPFTLLYGILGLGTGQVRLVSAGHPGPIYLPRDAPPLQLEVTGLPIGVETGHYQEQVVQLQPTDRLVLYSDGVTETRNADGEHFGIQRFLASLGQSRGLLLDK